MANNATKWTIWTIWTIWMSWTYWTKYKIFYNVKDSTNRFQLSRHTKVS